jgi:hypothetical protein
LKPWIEADHEAGEPRPGIAARRDELHARMQPRHPGGRILRPCHRRGDQARGKQRDEVMSRHREHGTQIRWSGVQLRSFRARAASTIA